MATDFLPSPSAAPSNRSKTETPAISLRSAPSAARTILRRVDAAVDDEGEVAPDRLEVGQLQHRLGPGRLRGAAAGIASRISSKPASGPSASSSSSTFGWNSPKVPMTVFGPWRIVPERPGWYQAGASAVTCTLSAERPSASSRASASALASKTETGAARGRPVAAAAVDAGGAAADGGGGGDLILRPVAAIDLADLEQCEIGRSRDRHCAGRRR